VIWRRKESFIGHILRVKKPAKGGDRGSNDKKMTKGKETIGYAERVSERIVICELQRKVENRKEWRIRKQEPA